jgi:hypothetical protein
MYQLVRVVLIQVSRILAKSQSYQGLKLVLSDTKFMIIVKSAH